jgi:hypothetical protein
MRLTGILVKQPLTECIDVIPGVCLIFLILKRQAPSPTSSAARTIYFQEETEKLPPE